MSYRISNIEKWKDMWFLDLSPISKILFFYFVENCDNAGFFEVNKKLILFQTGLTEDELMTAGTELKKSYIKSKDGTVLWFRNFLKYQKKLPLNYSNRSHKQIIYIIEENLANENKFKGNSVIKSLLPDYKKFNETKENNSTDIEVVEKVSESPSFSESNVRVRFVKPTIKEIYDYMVEKEFEFAKNQSEMFFSYYESQGWKVGKHSMKDWKSAIIGWMKRFYDKNKIKSPKVSKLEAIQKSHESVDNVDWNSVYK